MFSILDELGVDIDGLRWQDLGSCIGAPLSWFFEDFETDPVIAENVRAMCNSCLVRSECEQSAIDNKETGVWGGKYFERGVTNDE